MASQDVVVLGVGGVGSASAFHLARRGVTVRAFEQFEPGHDLGSSHGLTRIIRLAYYEDPAYVPLLRRAFALWRELESRSGTPLLHVTGAIDAGLPGSRVFEGSRRSCVEHRLPHQILAASEVNRRFPGYRLPDEYQAVFQPDGGFLEPERCIAAHVTGAEAMGVRIDAGVRVSGWRASADGVTVYAGDEVVHAGHLVVCAGAWAPRLLPALAPLLRPERQVVGWFGTRDAGRFAPERFPVFVMNTPDGHYYGFPEFGVPGFKIGRYHHLGEAADADAVDRRVTGRDEMALRLGIRTCFPTADGPLLRASVCLFTNTPDEHFIIDWVPGAPRVLLVSACSGHGFKFCSVLGEAVADLVTEGRSALDLERFRLDRFGRV